MKASFIGEERLQKHFDYPPSLLTRRHIGLGASLTNLWVKNSTGQFVDVVLGCEPRTE